MAKYLVELKPSARKELERLPAKLIERIFPKLEGLASEPRPAGCKKLKGGRLEQRIRVGNYRIVYTVDDEKSLVSVTRIRHRSEVYEGQLYILVHSANPHLKGEMWGTRQPAPRPNYDADLLLRA